MADLIVPDWVRDVPKEFEVTYSDRRQYSWVARMTKYLPISVTENGILQIGVEDIVCRDYKEAFRLALLLLDAHKAGVKNG